MIFISEIEKLKKQCGEMEGGSPSSEYLAFVIKLLDDLNFSLVNKDSKNVKELISGIGRLVLDDDNFAESELGKLLIKLTNDIGNNINDIE